MLDRALTEMVEHLVTGDPSRAGDRGGLCEIVRTEIAHAPRADLPLLDESLEGADRVVERMMTSPVEEIEVEVVGAQPA